MVVAILLPVLGGAVIPLIPFKNRVQMEIYIEVVVLAASVLVWCLLLNRPQEAFVLFRFTGNISVSFRLDGLGSVFAGIVATLWPLATLYAFEYMEHEGHERYFFLFYVVTYGVTLGIAFAEDILSLYFFYEMLTMVTVPLVMHTLTRQAVLASRTYLYYSIGGAAFAFIGMIFILSYGSTGDFVLGGVLDPAKLGTQSDQPAAADLCAVFLRFQRKSGDVPFSAWLPQAGVAPTPVTALLHAVAVVKAGAFATMRITYYSFGTEFLEGTWGPECGHGADGVYDCLRVQPGAERDASETALCLVYRQQPVLYSIRRDDDVSAGADRSAGAYGVSRGDEDLHLFLRRSGHSPVGREYVYQMDGDGPENARGICRVYGVGPGPDGRAGTVRLYQQMEPGQSGGGEPERACVRRACGFDGFRFADGGLYAHDRGAGVFSREGV